MRYLRTFESFSVKINEENETIDKQAIGNEIQTKFEESTPEEKEKIKAELESFAKKHGLSLEDLKDENKVQAALEKVKESLNEGFFGDKLAQFKNWIGGFLFKLGLGGMAATIIGTATAVGMVGEVGMQNPQIQATFGVTVGIAFGISALALIIGGSIPGEGRTMAQNTGAGAAAGRR